MASVSLEGIWKQFSNVPVIRGIDLEIQDGAFVTLVGPSGCGKSTLLRMVAGLETVSAGTLKIGDMTVNHVPPKSRDVAMVFQNYALYPHMNVKQNMSFALKLNRVAQSEIDRRVRHAAEILGLDGFLERYPRQLSGGQRQRVAMGRAIVRDPKVFLFDEPLSNLDAKLRVSTRAEIKALHQRLQTTTIYVTHDQVEAMTMSDLVVVMNNGEIEQIGTPLDVYDAPANTFVATFIGSPSMNLLEGRINGGRFANPMGLEVALPSVPEWIGNRELVLGIRPEHLEISDEPRDDSFQSEVLLVEPTGSETTFFVRSGQTEITCVTHDRRIPRPGDAIHLVPRTQSLSFFDSESGKRLAAD